VTGAGRHAGLLLALGAVVVFFAVTQDVFLTWDNMMNIVRANTVTLVLAVGMTFVVLSAGFDLSIGSATVAAGMILGLTLHAGWGAPLAVGTTLVFALGLGLANGVLIARAKIPFLVVTLGTLAIYQSFALVIDDGQSVSVFGKRGFGTLASFVGDDVGPFPVLLVFDAVLVLLAAGVLRATVYGRSLFAVGANPEAARLNGIDVGRILMATYAIAGVTAGLAALVQVGRLTSASPQADPALLLTVIAAVLIGGTAYTGGEGGVGGTVIGVLFLGVVQNGLTLSDVSAFWQGTISGVLLIAAVGLGAVRERRAGLTPQRGWSRFVSR
jgi:ribose/xylose/arabinose/galactoside ABC-type transport system permease subunit